MHIRPSLNPPKSLPWDSTYLEREGGVEETPHVLVRPYVILGDFDYAQQFSMKNEEQ